MHTCSLPWLPSIQVTTEHCQSSRVLYNTLISHLFLVGQQYICVSPSLPVPLTLSLILDPLLSHLLLSLSPKVAFIFPAPLTTSCLHFYSFLSVCFVEVPVTQSSLSTLPSAMILSFFFLLLQNLRRHMLHSLFPHPHLTSCPVAYFLCTLIALWRLLSDLACFKN